MSFAKILPVCVLIAIFAFVWMVLAAKLNLLGWVAFITWGGYFLSGIKTKNAIREAISFVLGVFLALAIIWAATQLTPMLGFYAFPVVVAVAAFAIVLLEIVPWFDMAPGYFLGAAALFAAGAKLDINLAISVIIPGLLGVVLGVCSAYLRLNVLHVPTKVETPMEKPADVQPVTSAMS